jgi:hypothetical protein
VPAAEGVEGDALATHEVRHGFLAGAPEPLHQPVALTDDGGGVGTGEPTVGGDEEHRRARISGRSVVSGWSTSEKLDSAETARVMARAYGAASLLRCWALTMREAAMSSIARVIFLVEVTERMRCR